ncbi:MAG: type II toxin-antitoxin system HipA family toxin [Cyanobacteria bacterium]|nr:type II toxin-antitoxin system HipA family toxin [Cyanobacteriota bacterium]MDA1020645.1 type II toxin-antitoxin system HipA family toxin [Cyanobacteriota bacterium]
MKFKTIKQLNVFLDWGDEKFFIGRLAISDRKIYFEYDDDFLNLNLEISPFKLPARAGVQSHNDYIFEGLFGVFNDSLPDAWGKLLLDRRLRSQNVQPENLTVLDRLAYVGSFAMGCLSYEPDYTDYAIPNQCIDIETVARESLLTLEGNVETAIYDLLSLNASAGGARPKIAVGISPDKQNLIHGSIVLPNDYEHWLIKFPALNDREDIGKIEYEYSLMAKAAGIEMPETYLFNKKFFGVKRFDRERGRRLHIHTASGLLHADHHYPSLDYKNLLKLTFALTKDIREVEKVYRLAVFNVLAHNRDDHSKNFSFIMSREGEWKFAPAYDLTYSHGPASEHSMLVAGEGKNPGKKELMSLAEDFDLSRADEIFLEVKTAIK